MAKETLLNNRKLTSWKAQAIALRDFVEKYKREHNGKIPTNAEIIAEGISGLSNNDSIRTCFNNIEALD